MTNCQQLQEELGVLDLPDGIKSVWFDADTLIYLAALTEAKFDLPIECAEIVLQRSMDAFRKSLEIKFGKVNIINCLSSPDTFRFHVDNQYKSNRDSKKRPHLLKYYIDVFEDNYNCLRLKGYEADDVVGMLHMTRPGHVLASGDKDLLQFPGTLYNPRTQEVIGVTLADAFKYRLYQWLVGDSADGYPGCYRIGKVKAQRFVDEIYMQPVEEIVEEVLKLYKAQNEKAEKAGKSSSDPYTQFILSQIQYSFDYETVRDPVLFLQTFLDKGQDNGFVFEVESDSLCNS